MEERLPTPRAAFRGERLPEAAAQRLARLEESLPEEGGGYRAYSLRELHEESVSQFINSPGFGVARMHRPSPESLTYRLRPDSPVPQPEPRTSSGGSPDESLWEPKAWDEGLYRVHRDGVRDFVNPDGFGYVKDRRHVAGFQGHQFEQVPGPAERWAVQTLDLVGLLLHDEPVAYVSARLPRMDELREAPTRPLDGFEASALEGLRRGEDLVVGGTPTGLRMLGAIRSTRQCVACHGGARGDLLGAFSYILRRSER
jgi:hypothetical protein